MTNQSRNVIEEVRNHLKEMLDCGVILPSHSPYAIPVVLVRKRTSPYVSVWISAHSTQRPLRVPTLYPGLKKL